MVAQGVLHNGVRRLHQGTFTVSYSYMAHNKYVIYAHEKSLADLHKPTNTQHNVMCTSIMLN